jgi:hypothetical protein
LKHLSKLTPAETLIVKRGDSAPLNELLKYTLMDLLLKQVLTIEEVERQPSSHDPIKIYKYVTTGRVFNKYKLNPHEIVFISIFQRDPSVRILFRNLVKLSYQKAQSADNYYSYFITNSANLKGIFKSTIYQRIFGGFNYTDKGTQLKFEIEDEIKRLEEAFSFKRLSNDKRELETLRSIGGNIFLLNGLDFAISKEIDKELFEEISKSKRSDECSGCWTSFHGYSETFDSSCSSDTGHGESGDSGCSGSDSGCSGCGGCGGD